MAPRRWGSADDELAEEGSRRFRTAGGRNESEGGEEGAAAAEEEEEDVLEGVDLYAVLNVPRDASEEEIQRAYRALAKTFHPDKHQDKTLQEAAAQSFTRLNEVCSTSYVYPRASRTLAPAVLPTDAPLLAAFRSRFVHFGCFSLPSQAYTILSNPEQRQVYDIYGMEGLKSGLEVGTKLKSREELRQQWQQFKAKKVSALSTTLPLLSL
jgi:DnaJ family protein C protein 11